MLPIFSALRFLVLFLIPAWWTQWIIRICVCFGFMCFDLNLIIIFYLLTSFSPFSRFVLPISGRSAIIRGRHSHLTVVVKEIFSEKQVQTSNTENFSLSSFKIFSFAILSNSFHTLNFVMCTSFYATARRLADGKWELGFYSVGFGR